MPVLYPSAISNSGPTNGWLPDAELFVTQVGTGTFVVPIGAYQLLVLVVANGGGSQNQADHDGYFDGGGSGGGAALSLIEVSANQQIDYFIGAGGYNANTADNYFSVYCRAEAGRKGASGGAIGGNGLIGDVLFQGQVGTPRFHQSQGITRYAAKDGWQYADKDYYLTETAAAKYTNDFGDGGIGIGDTDGGSYTSNATFHGKQGYIYVAWGGTINQMKKSDLS